ncbi:MAG: MFS transporter [Chitinophagales bacterium]|nr:MFS transporter [Chitinophagales bacterium]MDW8427324.1 MFS transporter [Chitinophagales bacterium]
MLRFPRTVWLLAWVSLLTDISSEMLYPVLPLYLTTVGFSGLLIGILEGCADVTSGLAKMYFGSTSDNRGRRKPFIVGGYLLSALGKTMLAVWSHPIWIFSARLLDRFGKGMRTAPRDALLNQQATPHNRAGIFGFHRAMDTAGAVIGPLLALAYLQYWPKQYSSLFLLAFVPAGLAVVLTLLLRERITAPLPRRPWWQRLAYWKQAPPLYRKLLAPLLLFAVIRTTDFFLLLRVQQITGDERMVLFSYILYNLSYAVFAYPFGLWADRWGSLTVLSFGLLFYASVFAGLAFTDRPLLAIVLLIVYGWYAAATEVTARALIGQIVPAHDVGAAMGFYTGMQSLGFLLAGAITGLLWTVWSPQGALGWSAAVALLCAGWTASLRLKNAGR